MLTKITFLLIRKPILSLFSHLGIIFILGILVSINLKVNDEDGIDRADAQLVGIRVGLCVFHFADGELGEFFSRVLDMLNFKPRLQHDGENLFKGGLGDEVVLKPGEGEFHDLFRFRRV